ncbi:hypothetical protein LI291_02120 [Intestinibacillus massiliensis]|nr:hypothetical protein [Intestinibacillus massiliensis]
MASYHLGIIERFDPKTREYESYTPEKYGCIAVTDDALEPALLQLGQLPTFWHTGARPAAGFAMTGVTLLPPGSVPAFRRALENAGDPALRAAIDKAREAGHRQKYMILYGL